MDDKQPDSKNRMCEVCGGTGQIGCFRGESRFLILYEDCLDCHGTGLVIEQQDSNSGSISTDNNNGQ